MYFAFLLTSEVYFIYISFVQAVFERSLMENPGNYVIRTSDRSTVDPGAASLAGESLVLRYFYQCYCRYKTLQNDTKASY